MAERTLADLNGRMSPWRIDCANRCMAQFAFRYLERSRDNSQSVAAAFGSALDMAANGVYSAKLKTHETPSANDAADRFASAWDYVSIVVDDWGDEDRGKLLDRGVAGAKLWRENVAQWVQPLSEPQVPRSKMLRDPQTGEHWELMGYVDLHAMVRDRETIVDLKAPGKRYSDSKVLTETQPVAYTLLTDVPRFEYHVVTNTPRPVTQVLGATIGDTHRDFFLLRASMIRRLIRAAYMSGDWLPNRQHTLCTRRYCDQWQKCEAKFGGEVRP